MRIDQLSPEHQAALKTEFMEKYFDTRMTPELLWEYVVKLVNREAQDSFYQGKAIGETNPR